MIISIKTDKKDNINCNREYKNKFDNIDEKDQ